MKTKLLFALLITSLYSFAQKNDLSSLAKCSHVNSKKTETITVNKNLSLYDVKMYYLDIEATTSSAALTGFTQVTATTVSELSTFCIELNSEINVDSVFVNNENVDFTHSNSLISVPLASPLSKNTNFNAKIYYKRPSTLNTSGFYNKNDWNWEKKVTFSLSEPYHAKNWFACKQDLLDKVDSTWIFVTVDENLKAGANGILSQVVDLGNGKHRYEWKSNYPIAYYLISIAVADYTEYSFYAKPSILNGDSILVQNYLYNNYSGYNNQKEGVEYTSELLEVLSDKYSVYPFWQEKYGHCFVPLGGAMEHQTMTTTGSADFYIIAHELGHQWFGDNVTCATWQDIWINEGFASYSEYLAYEFVYGESTAKEHLEEAQYYGSELSEGSLFVPFEELNDEGRIFSWQLTYRKGLCMVHMIRSEINNDEVFFGALRGFQTEFKDSTATGDDLKNYLNNHTNINFDNFFEEWYYGEGYPTYDINYKQDGNNLRLIVKQTTSCNVTPYYTNSLDIKLNYLNGDTTIRIKPKQAIDTFFVSINNEIQEVEFDPEGNILSGENTVSQTNGVEEDQQNQQVIVEIFPNPLTNKLNIQSEQAVKRIEVYNASGKLHHKENCNLLKNITIKTQYWNKGLYFIKVFTDSNFYSDAILKQ